MDFKKIEKKWQERWKEAGIFRVKEGKKKKFYVLEMYPYPSAAGLHMGHIRNYAMGDAYARFRRMQGYNVIYPMGYDAFGLPAENAAIKSRTHPKKYTDKAIAGIKKNQQALGLSYDWSREISTHHPEYYKWNQWFFLQMFKKKLAYKKEAPVNWCKKCKTVLANEQVKDGKCWRCEHGVEEKLIEQWFLKTTKYADELLKDLDKLKGWPEKIKTMQRNWIGKSNGVNIKMKIKGSKETIETFTTRHDTMYGMTFVVIAPEHPKVMEWVKGTKYEKPTMSFIRKVKKLSLIERTTTEKKPKRGVFLGKYAIHPFTKKEIPIYVADFVLMDFGTGIVQAVPAHDQRDFDFAKEYGLPIVVTIQPDGQKLDSKSMEAAYEGHGTMVNSKEFNGMRSEKALDAIAIKLEKMKAGKRTTAYKLRDWGISRQRYWGTPIPIIYCKKCGMVPVPEKDLPVILPTEVKFTGHGNPLANYKPFVETKCPKCKGKAKRETDTMDTFVDSSWYFLRYCSPNEERFAFDKKLVKYWMPVDQYIGGAEHAVMHLLYARFFIKVLRDLKLLNFGEPFTRLFNQGIVYKDGHKMSKSYGNIVTQGHVAKKYGTDTARLFLLFVAAPDSQLEWSDEGIMGTYRFIMRFWKMINESKKKEFRTGKLETDDLRMLSRLNSTIKKVTESMEGFRFNITVGTLMEFLNAIQKYSNNSKKPHKDMLAECLENLVIMLSPFAPHMCEESWEMIGKKPFVSVHSWPKADEKKIDPKFEMMENLVDTTTDDIREIIKLVGKSPKEIRIYVAPGWKHTVYKTIMKKFKGKKPDDIIRNLMKIPEVRKQGMHAVRFADKLSKVPNLTEMLSDKEEFQALSEAKEFLEKEFSCKVEVIEGYKSTSAKALRAEPGKPGIEVIT